MSNTAQSWGRYWKIRRWQEQAVLAIAAWRAKNPEKAAARDRRGAPQPQATNGETGMSDTLEAAAAALLDAREAVRAARDAVQSAVAREDLAHDRLIYALGGRHRQPVTAPKPVGRPAAEEAVPEVLDTLVGITLKSISGRAWTTADVADTLAMRPEIELSAKQLRAHIIALREQTGTVASRCYDPATKRWRYRG